MVIEILGVMTGILTVLVGGGGVLFYRQNKRMKVLEGNSKSIENDAMISDGWQEYAEEMKTQYATLKEKYEELLKKYENTEIENTKLKLEHQEISWWKCVVRGCSNRRPPREIDEIEQ